MEPDSFLCEIKPSRSFDLSTSFIHAESKVSIDMIYMNEEMMGIHRSVNDDGSRAVGSKDNDEDGNGRFETTPLLPLQIGCTLETSSSAIDNIDDGRKKRNRNGKTHQLFIRSPRSQIGNGGDTRANRDPPPRIITPNRHNKYSKMMTMMDHYKCSPSPATTATTKTPSTVGSTPSNSRRNHNYTSFSTFFSYSDNKDAESGETDEEGLEWRCNSDEEGSGSNVFRRDSIVSKLLREKLEQKENSHDEINKHRCKVPFHAFKLAILWSAGVCIWIFLFALSLSITGDQQSDDTVQGQSQWVIWDYIRYSSSIFWTVGGETYPGHDGSPISHQHRIITCLYMVGSLAIMGYASGNWGDSLIRAYDASLAKNSGHRNAFYAPNYSAVGSDRQHVYDRQRPAGHRHERRTNRRRHKSGGAPNYGSLPSPASKHNRYQWRDLSPLTFPDSSDDETEYRNLGKNDEKDDDTFVVFPRLHWLLVQSLVLTTLSAICVTTIRYCEQRHYVDRTRDGFDDGGHDEWDALPTLYYALSTATTVGVKNDFLPVSTDGKFFALLFVPLSVITSLHWIVLIAQSRIQNFQRIRYQTRKQEKEGWQDKILMDDSNRYDVVDPSRQIFFVGNTNHLKPSVDKGCLSSDDEDCYYIDNAAVERTPVSSASSSRGTESEESSLEKFYEQELQQMGLVDIETFRVLKRKYKIQERQKLKEQNGNKTSS